MIGSLAVAACGEVARVGLGDEVLIAFSDPTGISVIDPDGSNERVVVEEASGSPRWSPDGERMSYVPLGEAGFSMLEVGDLHAWQVTDFGFTYAVPFAWSPDGSQIAAGTYEGIFIVSAEGGEPRVLLVPESLPSAPSWTHDGDAIVVREGDRVVMLTLSGQETTILVDDGLYGSAVASPHSDRVVFARAVNGCTIEVVGLDGSGRTVVANDPDGECRSAPVWSPAGPVVAFCTATEDELRLWNTGAPGAGQRLLDEQPAGRAWGIDFSPGADFVVYAHDFDEDNYAGDDSVVELVDVAAASATPLAVGTGPSWRP